MTAINCTGRVVKAFVRIKSPIQRYTLHRPTFSRPCGERSIDLPKIFEFSLPFQTPLNSRSGPRYVKLKLTSTKHKARSIEVSLSVIQFLDGCSSSLWRIKLDRCQPVGFRFINRISAGISAQISRQCHKAIDSCV